MSRRRKSHKRASRKRASRKRASRKRASRKRKSRKRKSHKGKSHEKSHEKSHKIESKFEGIFDTKETDNHCKIFIMAKLNRNTKAFKNINNLRKKMGIRPNNYLHVTLLELHINMGVLDDVFFENIHKYINECFNKYLKGRRLYAYDIKRFNDFSVVTYDIDHYSEMDENNPVRKFKMCIYKKLEDLVHSQLKNNDYKKYLGKQVQATDKTYYNWFNFYAIPEYYYGDSHDSHVSFLNILDDKIDPSLSQIKKKLPKNWNKDSENTFNFNLSPKNISLKISYRAKCKKYN
jgi:hypothetical protein